VVAGTTGSGKSELLVTWVTAMAATRTPDEVAFLLVDFKGGTAFAAESRERAGAAGLLKATASLPASVGFDELTHVGGPGLSCAVGVDAAGPFTIDLVGAGPHAVVAGTTGSGKSELLVTWVTAMASTRSPSDVSFLLVDFKGGTAFAPLARLPHTVGVITDLGHGEALRALQSLRAELRRREGLLADAGARNIDQMRGALGRLVIVVDEFAAMLDAFPELNPIFTDVAARGRALGIHLILCTQRATGVVRDALLANCALRLSLRVTGAADSTAVLGTDAAARLSPATPGRCIVAHEGEQSTLQVAATNDAQIERVARAAAELRADRPTRPWLDPLPSNVDIAELEHDGSETIPIGLCDRPDEQRRHTVRYDPAHEHLFVCGTRGSGKSTLAAIVASQWHGPVLVVPDDVEAGWDAVQRAHRALREADAVEAHGASDASGGDAGVRLPTVVVIDDVDALFDRFDGEHRDLLADRLLALLRDGARQSLSVLCTASRSTPALRPLLPLFGSTIVLGQASKQDHLLAGAPAELFEERARPGLGVWHGHRIQLACDAPDGNRTGAVRTDRGQPALLELPAGSTTVLVSRAPRRVADRLRRSRAERIDVLDVADPLSDDVAADAGITVGVERRAALVLVGDPDAWLAQWPLLSRVRARARIAFESCSVADVRGIVRSRVLPPPLAGADGRVWVLDDSGTMHRARLW